MARVARPGPAARAASYLRGQRVHAHSPAVSTSALERHHAVDQCKQGVIAAPADVGPLKHSGAALADQHAPGADFLPGKPLDAKSLALRIAAVPAAANTLLRCHCPVPPCPVGRAVALPYYLITLRLSYARMRSMRTSVNAS